MRYDDWDVILFPKDSHVPMQEFKTACYVSADDCGQQSPTLTCYIRSLPPSTPFRISVHSWATSSKPSALIESQWKPDQRVVYVIQVVVDQSRVFHDLFDISSKWPQEIEYQNNSGAPRGRPTSQKKRPLEFPSFHQQILMQENWDPRKYHGRIKIILFEQLVSKTASPGEMSPGASNELICFSFQHAPKDVLEQAGISWPIRNPLYHSNAQKRDINPPQVSPKILWTTTPQNSVPDVLIESPLSCPLKSREKKQVPPQHLPSSISSFFKPPVFSRGNRFARASDSSFNSHAGSSENVATDPGSMKQKSSNSTGGLAMSDYMIVSSSHPSKEFSPWLDGGSRDEQRPSSNREGEQLLTEKSRQLVVTLQDDQLGQIIEAISPSKTIRQFCCGPNLTPSGDTTEPPVAHNDYPPNLGVHSNHPSPLSSTPYDFPAKTSRNSIQLTTNKHPMLDSSLRGSFGARPPMIYRAASFGVKENRPPSQSRLPTPYPIANRVPTPNPFSRRLMNSKSDFSTRDYSSAFSSLCRFDQYHSSLSPLKYDYAGAIPVNTVSANLNSRKEGMELASSITTEKAIFRDQISLLDGDHPTMIQNSTSENHDNSARGKEKKLSEQVEVIDVDAIDAQESVDTPQDKAAFTSNRSKHKHGMSSIDSTARLERQLFSALGEELASFDQQIDSADLRPELAPALEAASMDADASESTMLTPSNESEPTIKRKRQNTLGGDSGQSPMSKKERGVLTEAEESVPRLRGD